MNRSYRADFVPPSTIYLRISEFSAPFEIKRDIVVHEDAEGLKFILQDYSSTLKNDQITAKRR